MAAAAAAADEGAPGRWRLLILLLVAYTFNFVDRQILGILALPIKASLNLSDTQLGVLGGIAFALLYSTLAVPFAWLADRTSRAWVITGALAVWSGFTALCGLAGSFWQLFWCRLGVGIGEAGGVAPSYAMISDAFPPRQRARALAIYSLGIPLGSALGVLFGGYVAAAVDWRTAFIAVGVAGLVFAPLFRLGVREPVRVRLVGGDAPRFGAVLRQLGGKSSFWLLSLGAGSCSMMGYGLAFWLPSLLRRSFGLDLIETSQFFGGLLLTGGVVGVLAGGVLGDRLGARDSAAFARVPAIAFLIGVPMFVAGIQSGDARLAFVLFILPQALAYIWLAPILTAVQHLVAAPARATASACFLLINNLIGVGLGAPFIGYVSDRLAPRFGEESLRITILFSLGFYLLAAALMWAGSTRLRRDWVD
ncbi:Predicted arabinose efflux permease, MFS family [Sphingomonas jatrophae]|uniref:Predicted arabinose efflux permease, MFS family n=1 Tax=Sphingomonas jatrophae TaxID=1166337 RepID=A0A1I6MD29_9SPHN|nr:MFS transporter [Sphingomonas jatrophae]SFS13629.1 Predicted arabinose efflux permease, MFS family [Sphingomonas jatrophae]